jgi:hypothetical protein
MVDLLPITFSVIEQQGGSLDREEKESMFSDKKY